MNILITGGAGFAGSNLAIKLKQNYSNFKIIAFDNLKRRGSELNIPRLRENTIEFIHGTYNLSKTKQLKALCVIEQHIEQVKNQLKIIEHKGFCSK